MTITNRLAICLVATPVAIACLAQAQGKEQKVKLADLPAAVQKTVADQSKGATVKGFSREVEKGKTFYEAELTVKGHEKDILMDETGNVVEIEEAVSLDSLPAEVKDGLQKSAGAGRITNVESLTKGGKLIAYEAVVEHGSKRSEVQVGPDGKKLARPE